MRLAPELKSKIDTLWDRFWSGGLSNPLQSIEQMSYLIFMKRLEDMDAVEEKRAAANRQPYVSIFSGHENCRWSHWKHFAAEQMLIHVRDVVFPFIKTIHNGEKTLFATHMKDAVFMIPKPSLLQEAVGIIDDLLTLPPDTERTPLHNQLDSAMRELEALLEKDFRVA